MYLQQPWFFISGVVPLYALPSFWAFSRYFPERLPSCYPEEAGKCHPERSEGSSFLLRQLWGKRSFVGSASSG